MTRLRDEEFVYREIAEYLRTGGFTASVRDDPMTYASVSLVRKTIERCVQALRALDASDRIIRDMVRTVVWGGVDVDRASQPLTIGWPRSARDEETVRNR